MVLSATGACSLQLSRLGLATQPFWSLDLVSNTGNFSLKFYPIIDKSFIDYSDPSQTPSKILKFLYFQSFFFYI
jgi:hypothetical protein